MGYYESVNIINPEDAAILFKAEGHHPKRLKVEAWTSYRDYRNRKYGVLLKYVMCLSQPTCLNSIYQYLSGVYYVIMCSVVFLKLTYHFSLAGMEKTGDQTV